MRGHSRSRSLTDAGDITNIGRKSDPTQRRNSYTSKTAERSRKVLREMRGWFGMCWGGSKRVAEEERAYEKEKLLEEDSDEELEPGEERGDWDEKDTLVVVNGEAEEEGKAYAPKHAKTSFLRTATPWRMRWEKT